MSIFDNLTKITEFRLVKFTSRSGAYSDEPENGSIIYNGKIYYFKFNHEFDIGNTYIVYDGTLPVYYFMLYNDIYGEEGCPMVFEEQ